MFQKEEARRATGLLSLKGKRGTQGLGKMPRAINHE
jgi:hypothetical protein